MKYNSIILLLLALVLLLVQCTKDSAINPNPEQIPDNAVGITLQLDDMKPIQVMGTRSAVNTRATEAGVGDENKIDNVYIYLFSVDGTSLLDGAPFKFYAADNADRSKWVDANTVIIRKTTIEAAQRLVYVVANIDESLTDFVAALSSATSVSALKNVLKNVPISVPTPFLMEGHTDVAHSFTTNRRATVALRRAIAKVEFTIHLNQLPQLSAANANAYKLMQFGNRTWVLENAIPQDAGYMTSSVDWIPVGSTLTFYAYINEYAYTLGANNIATLPYILLNLPYNRVEQVSNKDGLPPPEMDPNNPSATGNIVLLPPPEFDPEWARQHNYYRIYLPLEIKRNHIYRYDMTVTQQGSISPQGNEEVPLPPPPPPTLALEYFAEYNVGTTPGTFAASQANNAGGYYTWEQATSATTKVCPAGYRVPTRDELNGVLLQYTTTYMYWDRFQNVSNIAEEIAVDGVTKTYLGDYSSTGNGINYAIRFKQATGGTASAPAATDNVMRTAYRYERVGTLSNDGNLNSHMKVTVRYLGTGFAGTVSTIANEAWWSANHAGDITRVFPAAGYNDGPYRNGIGFYWSSTKHDATSAWYLYFYSSYGGVNYNDLGIGAFPIRCIRE